MPRKRPERAPVLRRTTRNYTNVSKKDENEAVDDEATVSENQPLAKSSAGSDRNTYESGQDIEESSATPVKRRSARRSDATIVGVIATPPKRSIILRRNAAFTGSGGKTWNLQTEKSGSVKEEELQTGVTEPKTVEDTFMNSCGNELEINENDKPVQNSTTTGSSVDNCAFQQSSQACEVSCHSLSELREENSAVLEFETEKTIDSHYSNPGTMAVNDNGNSGEQNLKFKHEKMEVTETKSHFAVNDNAKESSGEQNFEVNHEKITETLGDSAVNGTGKDSRGEENIRANLEEVKVTETTGDSATINNAKASSGEKNIKLKLEKMEVMETQDDSVVIAKGKESSGKWNIKVNLEKTEVLETKGDFSESGHEMESSSEQNIKDNIKKIGVTNNKGNTSRSDLVKSLETKKIGGEQQGDSGLNNEALISEVKVKSGEDGYESDALSSLGADELLLLEDDVEYLSLFDNEEEASPDYQYPKKDLTNVKVDSEKEKSIKNVNKVNKNSNTVDHAHKDVEKKKSTLSEDEGRRSKSFEKDKKICGRDERTIKRRSPNRDQDKRRSPVGDRDKRRGSNINCDRRRSPQRFQNRRKSPQTEQVRNRRRSPTNNRDRRKSPVSDRNRGDNSSRDLSRIPQNDRKNSSHEERDKKTEVKISSSNVKNASSSVAEKEDTFKTIVLLADVAYEKKLKRFESPSVQLIVNQGLDAMILLDIVREQKSRLGKNVLWLLIPGLMSMSDTVPFPRCGSSCRPQLQFLKPHNDYPRSKEDIKADVHSLLESVNRLFIDIQTALGDDGVLSMTPPLPAAVIPEELFSVNHQKLHELATLYQAFIGNHESLERLSTGYNIFCEEWTNMACGRRQYWMEPKIFETFQKENKEKNLVTIINCSDYSYVTKSWTDTLQTFFAAVLQQPFPKFIKPDLLNLESNNGDAFDQVCILGSTAFTKDLQDLTKGMPVYYLDENVEFDEDGIIYLNEQQKKFPIKTLWIVLSGVSEVAEPYSEGPTVCKRFFCRNPLLSYVTKNHKLGDPDFKGKSTSTLVDIVIRQAFEFGAVAADNLGTGSAMFFAPTMPLKAIWAGDASPHSHRFLHRMFKKDPSVPFFTGSSAKWIECAKHLESKWLEKIISFVNKDSKPHRLLMQYLKEKGPVLEYIEDITKVNKRNPRKVWHTLMKDLIVHFLGQQVQPGLASDDCVAKEIPLPVGNPQPDVKSSVMPCPQPDVKSSVMPCPQPDVKSLVMPCPQPDVRSSVMPCPQPDVTSSVMPCPQPDVTSSVMPCPQPVMPVAPQTFNTAGPFSQVPYPSNYNNGNYQITHQAFPYQPPPGSTFGGQAAGFIDPTIPLTSFGTDVQGGQNLMHPGAPAWQASPMHMQVPSAAPQVPLQHYANVSAASEDKPQPVFSSAIPKAAKETSVKNIPIPKAVKVTSVKETPKAPSQMNSSHTIQAPPKLIESMGGHMVAQNVETDMDQGQARRVLEAFGDLGDMKWPLTQKDKPARFIMFNYKNRRQAERAERILNYLKVFGGKSEIKLIGAPKKEGETKLEAEDLELLLKIHEVIGNIKKESKTNKVITETVSHSQIPPESPKTEVKKPFTKLKALKQQILGTKQAWEKKEGVMVTEPKVDASSKPVKFEIRKGPARPKMMSKKAQSILTLKVTNYSELVPAASIQRMLKELGTVEEFAVKGDSMQFTVEGNVGELKLLDGYRFPDKKLQVEISAPDREVLQESDDDDDAARTRVNLAVSKVMDEIAASLKEKIESEINIYTFKTRLCKFGVHCKQKAMCPGHHDDGDRRRCPLLYNYSDENCPVMDVTGTCPYEDQCNKAHSSMEIIFHFKYFRSLLCVGFQKKTYCDKVGRICSSVHPDKPDMMYHHKWVNLYLEGLGKTIDFLAAAIRNLFVFPDLKCLRVLCITSTSEMANFYVKCVQDLGYSCNQRVAVLKGKKGADGVTVLVATLDAILHYLPTKKGSTILDCSRVKAVIFDDGPAIFKAIPKSKESAFKEFGKRQDVNIVITAEKITSHSIADAKEHLSCGCTFKQIYQEEEQQKDIKSTASEEKRNSSPLPNGQSPVESRDAKRSKRKEISRSSKHDTDKREQLPVAKSAKQSSETYEDLMAEYDRQLHLFTEMPEVHPEYEQKYEVFVEQYKKQYPGRYDFDHKEELWKAFWKELMTQALKEEFEQKIEMLQNPTNKKKGVEENWKSKSTERDLKDQCSDIQSNRLTSATKRKISPAEERHQFSNNQSDRLTSTSNRKFSAEEEYQPKQKYFKEERQANQRLSHVVEMHPPKPERITGSHIDLLDSDGPDLNLLEILALLEKVCPSLGILGPALQLFVQKLREYSSNNDQVCSMVQDSDNVMVLKMVSEKLKTLGANKGSGPEALQLQLASVQALKLINYPKTLFQEKSKEAINYPKTVFQEKSKQANHGVNIDKLAKATYNKDPAHIIQFIKNALQFEGTMDATNDDITDIYVAVTSLHFNMACSKPVEEPRREERLGLTQFANSALQDEFQESQNSNVRSRNFFRNDSDDYIGQHQSSPGSGWSRQNNRQQNESIPGQGWRRQNDQRQNESNLGGGWSRQQNQQQQRLSNQQSFAGTSRSEHTKDNKNMKLTQNRRQSDESEDGLSLLEFLSSV